MVTNMEVSIPIAIDEVYIIENCDRNTEADGSKQLPFSSLFDAYLRFPFDSETQRPIFYTRPDEHIENKDMDGAGEWKPVTKSALKKVAVRYNAHVKRLRVQEEEEAARQRVLAAARKVCILEDKSLPRAVKMQISGESHSATILLGNEVSSGTRVRVVGRIETLRASKTRTFAYLTDTRNLLLCIFSGSVNEVAPVIFQKQTALEVYGELKEVPPENSAPGNRELHVDYYVILGNAPGGPESFTNVVPAGATQAALPNTRHLLLRRTEEAMTMRFRASTLDAFRQFYKRHNLREATAPSFVQTQVEGGGELFSVQYYGQLAYLTQTSQLYLEALLPVLGDCYTIQSSFRAENSLTRRHLSEFMHIEAELDFITFEDLLLHIEDLICGVIDLLLSDQIVAKVIKTLNPDFCPPTRPFKRMRYDEAIQWLNEHNVLTDEGEAHVPGVDIAEAAERFMTDQIGVPIMLTHFPTPLKAFYMKPDVGNPDITQSVDCLVPGVGEIIGSGMRIDDYEELVKTMTAHKFDLKSYQFYLDQRKYGSSPHGGYGLGLERFLAWVLGRHSVRECVAFPRYPGKCTP